MLSEFNNKSSSDWDHPSGARITVTPPYIGGTYKWRVECLWVLEGDQPGGKCLPHSRQISLLGIVQQQVTFVLNCSLCRAMINSVCNTNNL